ncbi:hypothetical protein V496_00040 [Pseudogymnoascus sp. VKM F-4515 (FW-2607)]|nr:hypothetical protein V496_00040 [Pseudogymnoascus sp. VKM F-4515 (FW-2607)]
MFTACSPCPAATPSNSRPSHHANDTGTAFKNPWLSAEKLTWAELLRSKFPLGWYGNLAKKHPGKRDVEVVAPDWGAKSLMERGLVRDMCIVGTTLGHAGAITELPLEGIGDGDEKKKSFWVVYHPIFSLRVGPVQYTGLRG